LGFFHGLVSYFQQIAGIWREFLQRLRKKNRSSAALMKKVRLFIILAMVWGQFPQAVAQEAVEYPDFSFRRVAVPKAGTVGRIDVQIDPETQFDALPPIASPRIPEAEKLVTVETPDIAKRTDDPYGWYWAKVSPDLADASAGRLERAVNSLALGPQGQVSTPRLGDMQEIADSFGKDILRASIGTQVSPAFALAVISVESSGRVAVESSAGASGLMQLIPATAERFGVKDVTDPADNIRGGVAYLDWLMGQFDNDPILVLAAYNAGENAVRKNNGVPEYAETRAYVPKVLAAWTVARGLCLTPPQLVSDGCVFSIREARSDG